MVERDGAFGDPFTVAQPVHLDIARLSLVVRALQDDILAGLSATERAQFSALAARAVAAAEARSDADPAAPG